MTASRHLRSHRLAAGLTQGELAVRAGISRAMVSAIEAGRHLPRIDAALALADALGVSVATVFAEEGIPLVDAIGGVPPLTGTPVRLGRVGTRLVSAAPRHDAMGWEPVDGIVGDPSIGTTTAASVVVAGCEPGLPLLERLLANRGVRALAIPTCSAAAVAALTAGRLHAAAVHFDAAAGSPRNVTGTLRIHLARWRVGLAAPREWTRGWGPRTLRGRGPVVQREPGAAVQQAFLRACGRRPSAIEGPRVATHLAASRLAMASGIPAVTIEPAAAAVGAAFHPLETHDVELWIAAERMADPDVERMLGLLASAAFRRPLAAAGGYDLSRLGSRVA